MCHICKDGLISAIESLAEKASQAIKKSGGSAKDKDGDTAVEDDDNDNDDGEPLDADDGGTPPSLNDSLLELQREIVSWGLIEGQ